jgi:hypothetical protein
VIYLSQKREKKRYDCAIIGCLRGAGPHQPDEHLQGVVERVTFHSDESGYTVLRFHVPLERELVTIIGRFPEIHAGQTLHLTGVFREETIQNQVLTSKSF